jgi:hypothetical protein
LFAWFGCTVSVYFAGQVDCIFWLWIVVFVVVIVIVVGWAAAGDEPDAEKG